MAIELQGFKITAIAGETQTSSQFLAMRFTAEMTVMGITQTGKVSCGVLQNDPHSGGGSEIMVSGLTKVVQGASVAAGALITVGAAASVIGVASGCYSVGQMALNGGASAAIGSALISCFAPNYMV